MHGLFVDEMAHASISQKRIKKFIKEYSKDFKYTRGDFMTTFLGLEVEQDKGQIRLHLNTYVNELLEDYKAYIKRNLEPEKVPLQPGVVLTKDNAPETQIQKNRKNIDHLLQKYNLYQTGSGMMFLLQHHNWLVLCICGRIALGCIASCDGISAQQSQFQTRIWFRWFRSGKQ
jgi:hypothetical protein